MNEEIINESLDALIEVIATYRNGDEFDKQLIIDVWH